MRGVSGPEPEPKKSFFSVHRWCFPAGSSVATLTAAKDLLVTALTSLHRSGGFERRVYVPIPPVGPVLTGLPRSLIKAGLSLRAKLQQSCAQQGAEAELLDLIVINGELLTSSQDIVRQQKEHKHTSDWHTFSGLENFLLKGPSSGESPWNVKTLLDCFGCHAPSMLRARWCHWLTQMDCGVCNSCSDYWGITFLDHVIEWQRFSTVGAFQSTCFYVHFELGHQQLWVEIENIWGNFWLRCKCWFIKESKYEKLK